MLRRGRTYGVSGVVHTHWEGADADLGFSNEDTITSAYFLEQTPLFLIDQDKTIHGIYGDGSAYQSLTGLQNITIIDLMYGFSLYDYIYK